MIEMRSDYWGLKEEYHYEANEFGIVIANESL